MGSRRYIKMATLKMRFPGGVAKALTLSYDDGSAADVRMMYIIHKYGIRGTFNLNSDVFNGFPEGSRWADHPQNLIKAIKETGNEPAGHTCSHIHPDQVSYPKLMHEVLGDRERLEDVLGTIVRGFAYPFGTHNEDIINALKLSGIAYGRICGETHWFGIPEDWYRWQATCHHSDGTWMNLAKHFINEDGRKQINPMLFYIWGHASEFDTENNWEDLEKFCQLIGGRDDIWYATNIEIHDYIEGYRRLIMSADENIIYNPNAFPIWMMRDNDVIKFEAGETKRFN